MAQPQAAMGQRVQQPPPHVVETMQYMQRFAMDVMMYNPYSWYPPYGPGNWGMDDGYDGAPHPADVPQPTPAAQQLTEQPAQPAQPEHPADAPRQPPSHPPPPNASGLGDSTTDKSRRWWECQRHS